MCAGVITWGPYLWGPRSSTGVAEVVKVKLTSEVSCWPFPCPGLPHHRCLPDPTESQGTPRLRIAWQQEAQVWERSHHWSLSLASGTRRSLWDPSPRGSCRTGPPQAFSPGTVPLGRSHWGHTVPCSFLTTEPWFPLRSSTLGSFPQAAEQGWSS